MPYPGFDPGKTAPPVTPSAGGAGATTAQESSGAADSTKDPTTGLSTYTNVGSATGQGGSKRTDNPTVPVDKTGALDIWGLPAGVAGQTIWFGTDREVGTRSGGTTAHNAGQNMELQKGNTPTSLPENMTAERVMKMYAAMSQSNPDGFLALQKQLAQAGFYGTAAHVQGGWNSQTESALAGAMTSYLQVAKGAGTPLDFSTFLGNQVKANYATGGGAADGSSGGAAGTTPQGPSIQLTDPNSLKSTLQQWAQQALGRNVSDDEANSFVSQFQSAEGGAQATVQGGQVSNAGSLTTTPDATSDAEAFIKSNNATDIAKSNTQGYANTFVNMFLPSGSQMANIQPFTG